MKWYGWVAIIGLMLWNIELSSRIEETIDNTSLNAYAITGLENTKEDFMHLNPDPNMKAEYGADYIREQFLLLEEIERKIGSIEYKNDSTEDRVDEIESILKDKGII